MQIVTNTLSWWWLLILQAQFFYLSSEELLNCEGQTFDGAYLLLSSIYSPFSMERRGTREYTPSDGAGDLLLRSDQIGRGWVIVV